MSRRSWLGRTIKQISNPFYQIFDNVTGLNTSGKNSKIKDVENNGVEPIVDNTPITAPQTPTTQETQIDKTDTGLGDIVSIFNTQEEDDWTKVLGRYK